ncbi:chitobiase/beta-hexosaminidase C-terminal domain-containing protein [Pendulispora rubella]|uniref:Chitobiase/beta-hexosaminidase C-terminal domain-containing protein n=1 Tax=Pendulispora rubella TaxID=2741070 RepID=A0ABZ2LIL0_9BACT
MSRFLKWRELLFIVLASSASVATTGCGDGSNESRADVGPDANSAQQAIASPEFQPGGGTFDVPLNVIIVTSTAGAVTHYTLDGTRPDATSPIYSSPLNIAKSVTLRAIARKAGSQDSEVRTATYVVNTRPGIVQPVQFEPNSGDYSNDVLVTLTSGTAGATFCYTLDGSAPACSDQPRCSMGLRNDGSPIQITKTNTQLRAVACAGGMHESSETHAKYTLTADKPAFDPPASNYDPAHPVPVTLTTTTKGGVIHYTTDGTAPGCESPLTFNESGTLPSFTRDTTIRALTCKENYATGEDVSTKYSGEVCIGDFKVTRRAELEALTRCKEISGDLDISARDVVDLASLSHLTRVGGSLRVHTDAEVLQSMHGLESLTQVGQDLLVIGNPALTNVDGLASLRGIAGSLKVKNTDLVQFDGMPRLSTIGSSVVFEDNRALESIAGFASLRDLGLGFYVRRNPKTKRFVAPPHITTIREHLSIESMPELSDINLENLERVVMYLSMDNVPALTSFQGFRNLSRVGGLGLSGHLGMANMKGFEQLTRIDGPLVVLGTTGLVNLTGLENLITASALRVHESTLENFHGLDKLALLTGDDPYGDTLEIIGNKALTEIDGFGALTQMNGGITIAFNDVLKKVKGPAAVGHVQGSLTIENNPILESIDGFGALTTVDLDVIVTEKSLRSLSGFRSLEAIGGSLDIENCPALRDLSGFEALKSIGMHFIIMNNEALTRVNEVSRLTQLGGKYFVSDNASLPMCQPTKLAERLRSGGYTGEVHIHDNGGTGTCN